MDREAPVAALERARRLGPTVEGLLDLALAYHLAGDVGGEVAPRAGHAARARLAAAWARYAHALARTDRVTDAPAPPSAR